VRHRAATALISSSLHLFPNSSLPPAPPLPQIDVFLEQLQCDLDDRRGAAAAVVAAAGARAAQGAGGGRVGEGEGDDDAAGGVLTRESLGAAVQGWPVKCKASAPTSPPLPSVAAPSTPPAIADLVSWAAQCHGKAALAAEVLQLLAGRRRGKDSGTAAAAAGAAWPDGEAAAAADLAGCLAVAGEVAKDADALAAGALEGWQAATADWLAGIAAWKGSRLISVDAASRHVNAHFSESLVVLLREVRGPAGSRS
jgi:hypothetical protein